MAINPTQPALYEIHDDIAQALAEVGIALHDCDGPGRPRGGCCLTPTSGRDDYPAGIIVAWTCADTLSSGGLDGDRDETYGIVQDTMSEALWTILDGFGFPIAPFGLRELPLVTGLRPPLDRPDKPFDLDELTHLGSPPRPDGEPLYGEPVTGVTEISPDGVLGRACANCGRLAARLHFPQARDSSAVCCSCFTGGTLIADDEHPAGHWVDLGACPGHGPA